MRRLAAIAALLVLVGCKKHGPGSSEEDKSHRYGVRVANDGEVAKVTPAPDGKWLAFLGQVARPKELGVPEGIFLGVLELVPSDNSAPARQLLGGVTNLPGAFGFSSDGAVLAAIKSFRFATHTGTLETVRVSRESEPVALADDCSSFLFAPDGKHLAWVCETGAFLGNADGSSPRKLTENAATVEFSRDSKRLLVRKVAAAGGELLLFDVAGDGVRTLAKKVGDYAFSPEGTEVAFTVHSADPRGGWDLKVASAKTDAVSALAEGVSSFHFSPDGKWVGYIAGVTPSKAFGDLFVASSKGGKSVKVGERVEEFDFSPSSGAVAFLAKYDANARSGTVALQKLPPAQPAELLHRPSNGFEWSPKGEYLAYSALVLRPAVSLDLELLPLQDLKPAKPLPDGGADYATGSRQVAAGVFGYQFVNEEKLLYRSDCIMEGRACDLYEVPTGHAAAGARLTGGVWRFSISKDGERMLLTYPRVDSETVADLGAMNLSGYGGVIGLDHSVELGASFLDDHGERAAYGIIDKRRRGVYVATIPLPKAGELPPNMAVPGFKATYSSTGALGGGR